MLQARSRRRTSRAAEPEPASAPKAPRRPREESPSAGLQRLQSVQSVPAAAELLTAGSQGPTVAWISVKTKSHAPPIVLANRAADGSRAAAAAAKPAEQDSATGQGLSRAASAEPGVKPEPEPESPVQDSSPEVCVSCLAAAAALLSLCLHLAGSGCQLPCLGPG